MNKHTNHHERKFERIITQQKKAEGPEDAKQADNKLYIVRERERERERDLPHHSHLNCCLHHP